MTRYSSFRSFYAYRACDRGALHRRSIVWTSWRNKDYRQKLSTCSDAFWSGIQPNILFIDKVSFKFYYCVLDSKFCDVFGWFWIDFLRWKKTNVSHFSIMVNLRGHPLCRLKNPTVVYMITCRLSSCKTGVYNVHLLIILERGCSTMYRKKSKRKNSDSCSCRMNWKMDVDF